MARFHSSSVAAHVGPPMRGTTASSGPGALLGVATAPGGPIRPDRDTDLVAKLRAQAPDAVETLVARYGDLLYRHADPYHCRRRWPLTVKGRLDPAGIPTKEAA